jgi:phycocyanobilin lyase subunit beta
VVQQDDEWVVRYSAVVGLQALAGSLTQYPEWRSQILTQLEQGAATDENWAVRARACEALRQLQLGIEAAPTQEEKPASLLEYDWQAVLANLYARKGDERLVLSEGDPRRYRQLAVAIVKNSGT